MPSSGKFGSKAAKGFLRMDFDRVIAQLRRRETKGTRKTFGYLVGFSAPYAVYVHEDLATPHRVGQAKFLEAASREEQPVMAEMIKNLVKGKEGIDMDPAIKAAAEYLKVKAQAKTPVSLDGSNGNPPGFLRDSAYVQREDVKASRETIGTMHDIE